MLWRALMAGLVSLGRLPGGSEFKLRPEERTLLPGVRLERRILAEGTKAVTWERARKQTNRWKQSLDSVRLKQEARRRARGEDVELQRAESRGHAGALDAFPASMESDGGPYGEQGRKGTLKKCTLYKSLWLQYEMMGGTTTRSGKTIKSLQQFWWEFQLTWAQGGSTGMD